MILNNGLWLYSTINLFEKAVIIKNIIDSMPNFNMFDGLILFLNTKLRLNV